MTPIYLEVDLRLGQVFLACCLTIALLSILVPPHKESMATRLKASADALKADNYNIYWEVLDSVYSDGAKQPELALYCLTKGVQQMKIGQRNLGLHLLGEATGFDPNFTGARIASDILARNLPDEEMMAAMLKEVNELSRPEAKWLLEQTPLPEKP